MITINEYRIIDEHVKNSVKEAFEFAKINSLEHDYVLFLANGEYHKEYDGAKRLVNPFTIDNRLDNYKDETRNHFFIEFMKSYYSFFDGALQTDDNEFRISIELMVYSHVWESKPFLKQLYKLAKLCAKNSYPWDVSIPDMSKHEFIRTKIRDSFSKSGLDISNVISSGFHTSLRNAFAHSEYTIDLKNKRIVLDTYKSHLNWDIREITLNDWTIRFVNTALLTYYFMKEKHHRRINIVKDLGKSTFNIIHPINKNKFTTRQLCYESSIDSFYFKQ